MAKSIENKVVSLELDDSKFSSKVEGVLKNVNRLKDGMNFKTANTGLDNITPAAQSAAKGMNGLANSVKNVNTTVSTTSTSAATATSSVGAVAKQTSTNFTMLGGAASVALGNIAAKAITAGGSMLSSFAFGPILDGFREYENQLNAVQTIQANTFSKGETIATINAALDELNQYADKTIYSFSEMTKNIGMFTSAGVGLKESVSSIKGLSNVAAMSGASSAQAATAMYQLSQALSTGVVKLQDWNSIVNAGMGGEQFQESLKRTARTYGVEVDAMIEKAGSFRTSLAQNWLTSDIMIETLAQYTGDLSKEQLLNAGYTEEQTEEIMKLADTANDAATKVKTFAQLMDTTAEALGSGWAALFRTFFGDFERARYLWTAVGDTVNGVIGSFFDAVQGILDRWDELGGWYEWWYTLLDLWKTMSRPIYAIGNALKDVFSGDGGKVLFEFSKYLHHEIANWLIMTNRMATDMGLVFKMVAQLLKPVVSALITFGAAVGQVAVAAGKIGLILLGAIIKPLLRIGAKVSEIVTVFADWFSKLTGGIDVLSTLGTILDTIVGWVQALVDWFTELASLAITPFFNGIRVVIEALLPPIAEFLGVLKDSIKSVFGPVSESISKLGFSFKDFLKSSTSPFGKMTRAVTDWGISFYKTMEGIAQSIGPEWSSKVKKFSDSVKPLAEAFGKNLAATFDNAAKAVSSFWSNSKPGLLLAWDRSAKIASDTFKTLAERVSAIKDAVKDAFGGQLSAIKSFGSTIASSLNSFIYSFDGSKLFANLGAGFKEMMNSFGPFGKFINATVDAIAKIGSAIANLTDKIFGGASSSGSFLTGIFGKLATAVHNTYDTFGFLGTILLTLTNAMFTFAAACTTALGNLVSGLFNGIAAIKEFAANSTAFASFKENIGSALNSTGKMIQNFWNGLGDSLQNLSLSDLLSGVLLGGGLGMGFKTLQNLLGGFQNLTDSANGLMGKIGGVFSELQKSLSALTEAIKAKSLRDIAVSVGILAASLFVLAMLPAEQLIQGAIAIGVLAKILTASMSTLAGVKVNPKKFGVMLAALIVFSAAMVQLSIAALIMGSMDTKALLQGIVAVGLMLEGLVQFAKQLAKNEKQMISGAATILGMALAINMLILPVTILGALPTAVIMQGLVAVSLLMAGIAAFVYSLNKSTSSFEKLAGVAVMLLGVAHALVMISAVVVALGMLPRGAIIQGLLGMSAALTVMAVVATKTPPTALAGAYSVLALAVAMLVVSTVLQKIGQIPWDNLLSSALKMGAVLAVLVIAARSAEGSWEGAAAVIMMAVAVRVLASAIGAIAALDASKVGIALLAIAGGLLIFIGAAALAPAVAAGILILTAAIAVLGGVTLAIIGSLILLVMVVTAFVAAISMAGPAIGAGIVSIAAGIAAGATIIAAAAPAIEAALVGVANAVKNAAPALGEALKALAKALGPALVEFIKVLGKGIRQLAVEVIRFLYEQGPQLTGAIITFLANLLGQLAARMPEILANLLIILDTVLSAIDAYLPQLGEHLLNWLNSLMDFLFEAIPTILQFVIDLVVEIANTLADNVQPMVDAGVNLITAWLNGMASMAAGIIDAAFQALITFINAFSDAIDQRGPELKAAVNKLVNSIKNFLFGDISNIASSVGDKAASIGRNIIDGIKNGLNNAKNKVLNTMKNLANSCLDTVKSYLGIQSPSRKFAEVGKFMMLGMSKGLGNTEDTVYRDLRNISEKIMDTMDLNMDYAPVIKPTVDTSEIQGLRDLELNDVHASVVGSSVQNGSQMQQEIRALREELKRNQTPTVFNQYNTSPKALDLNEIYRQTERQIDRMKRI